jgi:serine phosphatase RsbU (regulator of sigma subunit)
MLYCGDPIDPRCATSSSHSKERSLVPTLRMRGDLSRTEFPLDRQVTVIGSRDICDIVLRDGHVSKRHARIERESDGFYIEDLQSKNGTKVGGEKLTCRVRLNDGDLIEICGHVFVYSGDEEQSGITPIIRREIDASTVYQTAGQARPEDKLRTIMEIAGELAGVIELDPMLEKILTSLFRIFPQAERGFFLFRGDGTKSIVTRASKVRDPNLDRLTVSRAIYEYVTDTRRAILCEDITLDSRFKDSPSVKASQARTVMCVPLWDDKSVPVGILQIDTRDAKSPFGKDDLVFLNAVAGSVSMAVENARLREISLRHERMEQEAMDARAVQQSLIPDQSPSLPGYEFWHAYEPALFVGGDYFDYRPVSDPGEASLPSSVERWAIALGDVSGKGMPAALLMARLSSEVRLLLQVEPDLARVVERLNRNLCSGGMAERFVTFLLVLLEGQRNVLTVVIAGHMGPIIRRADGRVEVVGQDRSGPVLGVIDRQAYTATITPLGAVDVAVLYTDGVSEALDAAGNQFGIERIKQSMAAADPRASSVGLAIMDAVRRHAGRAEQNDDITLICFGRT